MATFKGKSQFRKKGQRQLTADDFNQIQTQRRQINQQFRLGRAQNRFERRTAGSNFRRQRGDILREFKNRFGEFQGDFVEGGLLNSGLYAQGVDRFNTARNQQIGDLLAGYRDRLGALRLADTQLGQIRRSALNDVASAAAARRSTVAAELRRAKRGL